MVDAHPSSMTLSRRRFLGISGAGAASLVSHPLIEPLRDWANAIGDRRTDFAALRASIKGSVILPADGGYDRARRVWSFNPRTDVRPAAIVRCAEAADVAKSIAFARTESLDLAIRGGGHDILGASSCEGGLVVICRG